MSEIMEDSFGVRHKDAALESGDVSPQSKYKSYPEYNDSGVGWLRKIPVHWEAKRLKRLFKVVNGSTPRSEEPSYWDGDIP
jgi:restriction endonuclease S subunit